MFALKSLDLCPEDLDDRLVLISYAAVRVHQKVASF